MTALWDPIAACPSVAHSWLFDVLHAIKAPQRVINLVRMLYSDVKAFMCIDGEFSFLLSILSGVLTGCTLSGMHLDICIEPFLWFLWSQFVNVEVGRALVAFCATD